MSDINNSPLWVQFRRLFVGTLVEALGRARIRVPVDTLGVLFSDESIFAVPRLDNEMRFVGEATAMLDEAPSDKALGEFRGALSRAWPDLIAAVQLPIGDQLTVERNDIDVGVVAEGQGKLRLVVRFDLEAD